MQIAQDMAGFTLGEADVLRNRQWVREGRRTLLKAQRREIYSQVQTENSISQS